MQQFHATCPDPGLDSYLKLEAAERAVPRTLIWIGALIAIEQCLHAAVIALSVRHRRVRWWRFEVTPRFVLPIALTLLWAFFTALSIFMVAITFRSNAAVLAKTVHIAVEASFIILLASAFGYTFFAALATTLVVVDLVMVLALPCVDTIMLAATSGLVLDAVNFLAYTWYGVFRADEPTLWTLIGGLGCHALYLLTYVGVQRWGFLSDFMRISMRMVGMLANLVADEFFLSAARQRLDLFRGGWIDVRRWKNVRFDPPRPVWTKQGLRLLGDVIDDGEPHIVTLHAPHRTGYMFVAASWRTLCALWPLASGAVEYTRKGGVTTLRYSFLCTFSMFAPEEVVDVQHIDESGLMFVPSFVHLRPVLWLTLVFVGVGIGQME